MLGAVEKGYTGSYNGFACLESLDSSAGSFADFDFRVLNFRVFQE